MRILSALPLLLLATPVMAQSGSIAPGPSILFQRPAEMAADTLANGPKRSWFQEGMIGAGIGAAIGVGVAVLAQANSCNGCVTESGDPVSTFPQQALGLGILGAVIGFHIRASSRGE